MAYQFIIVDISDEICTITLNRPEALNALSTPLLGELATALEAADDSPEVRCIILAGSDKAFAAGADVSEMADKSYVEMANTELFRAEAARLEAIRKPIIAAVAGYCLGGGCELAMLCDTVIAADTARFGQPEINLGVIAGMGGTQRMAKAIGKAKTMDMHLTGRMMDATEAERSGLVSQVVPAKDLAKEARSVATKVAEKSLLAARAVKDAVNTAFEAPLAEGLRSERRLFQSMFATEDQKEGMAAFLEKRQPQFRDK